MIDYFQNTLQCVLLKFVFICISAVFPAVSCLTFHSPPLRYQTNLTWSSSSQSEAREGPVFNSSISPIIGIWNTQILNTVKGRIQSKKNKKFVEFSTPGSDPPTPQAVWKNTTYFFKAFGIIVSNFGQNHFFPLKKSKILRIFSQNWSSEGVGPPLPHPPPQKNGKNFLCISRRISPFYTL